jgi:hypothetical protein
MNRLALTALPLLLAACAAGPAPTPTAALPTTCPQLAAEQQRADSDRLLALQQKETAWKAVIPFAVAARYAKSKSAAEQAQQRADALGRQAAAQGCLAQGG